MSMDLLNEVQALFEDIKECGRIEEFLELRLSLLMSPSDVKNIKDALARYRKKAVKVAEEKNKSHYVDLLKNSLGDEFKDLGL